MSTYVSLPLTDEYLRLSDDIIEKLRAGEKRSLARDTVKSTNILIDNMFEIIIDDMVENVTMKPFAKKVVIQVGSLSRKTVNTLVDKVVKKLSNKELLPLVGYFKDLELEHEGQIYMAFRMEDDLEECLDRCLENLESGDVEAVRKDLVTLLVGVANQSIELNLVKPMSLIKLGMISRKVVDFVETTLEKAIPPAIKKIVKNMDQEELESLRDFLMNLLIRGID